MPSAGFVRLEAQVSQRKLSDLCCSNNGCVRQIREIPIVVTVIGEAPRCCNECEQEVWPRGHQAKSTSLRLSPPESVSTSGRQ